MTTARLITERQGPIGRLVLNNPERLNALTFDMWTAIPEALAALAVDPALRVLVLAGAGDKAFAAGADISQFEGAYIGEAVQQANETIERAFAAIERFPRPTIAEIRGYCIGGGMAVALCCDMRIAAEGARFGIPPARLGLGYDHMSVRRVVDLVGPAAAKEILFTARQFSTAEALAMGLVNRVVPSPELAAAVAALARAIAAAPAEDAAEAKRAALSLGGSADPPPPAPRA